jgi:pimeloyl-ACP methyl ester carboxylesterase
MPHQMVTLAYHESGSGPPLVLLHGFPFDARMWDDQHAGLSDIARVITPDLHGFGRSGSDHPFTMESQADDVHELLSSIGGLPCVLAGMSMGGYIALAYLKKYRADVRALALIDTKAAADDAEGKRARDQMIELARMQGSKAIADKMQPKIAAPETPAKRPKVLQRMREIMEQCPPLTIQHALAAMRDRPDHTATLGTIDVPTLIIVGAQDAVTPPSAAEQLRAKIRDARLATIPDAGHMAVMEEPQLVNQALRDFLNAAMKS